VKINVNRAISAGALTVFLSACDIGGQTNSELALDLSVVAKAVGRDTTINQQVVAAENQLNQRLAEIKIDLKTQLKSEIGKISESSEKEQIVKNLEVQVEQEMRSSITSAQQQIQQYRVGLVKEFRNEVKALAGDIASERQVSVVRLVNGSVLWLDDGIDITGEVIAQLRAQAPPTSKVVEPERVSELVPGGSASAVPQGDKSS